MSRKIVVLCALLMLGLGAASAAPSANYEIKPADRTLGNPKAKVVLIEYGALSCPICAAFNAEVMPQIKSNYIDKGKLLYIFRQFPRMPEDGIGEKLARCVARTKYFDMVDLFYTHQKAWDPEMGVKDGAAQLGKLAMQAGLTKEQVNKCSADKSDDKRINEVAQEAVDRYALTGTPTLVINGDALPSGYIPYADLAKLLNKADQTKH